MLVIKVYVLYKKLTESDKVLKLLIELLMLLLMMLWLIMMLLIYNEVASIAEAAKTTSHLQCITSN